jgi:hypothetical protein
MIVRNSIHDSSIKTRKYSIEEIKSRIVGEPFELISTEYVNAHEKLEWKCLRCGNSWMANWHNISFGKGCRNCRYIKTVQINERKKPSTCHVREFLFSRNIQWLDDVYINAHTKMSLVCMTCGLQWSTDFHHIKGQNSGCPSCAIRKGYRHHWWRGGTHYQGYPKGLWTDELKEYIRNRDNRRCQYFECGYKDTEQKQKLHVHHINGHKDDCRDTNLISLCNRHHMYIEANNARGWEDYFYQITAEYEVR